MKLHCTSPMLRTDGQKFNCDLTLIKNEKDVSVYKFMLASDELVSPKPVSVQFVLNKDDVYSVFHPNASGICTLAADWSPVKNSSRSGSGAPIVSLIGRTDNNRCTVSLSDCKNPTCISAGLHEEDCSILLNVAFFTETVSPLKEYSAEIRLDFRDISASESIKAVRAWWKEIGYVSAALPDTATLPMYSTWYSMHQDFTADKIKEQCALAKELGMNTVIIDDGWQTDDNNRGYAYCGDWEICTSKLPDFKSLVNELHSIGMKVMVWFSVPYVGKNSKCAERFVGKYLYFDSHIGAYVLDPRFPQTRSYLCGVYENFAKTYGIDGFKLDFIDSFFLTEQSQKGDLGDCVSLEDGICKLLDEIECTLKSVNPDMMIEFRQTYMGGVMQRYGNMIRVSDCPANAHVNKFSSLELRLLSYGVAVHADPIVWRTDESAENAAMQLNHTLYAVPQISMDLTKLPQSHKKMLAYYMKYQRKNKDILLFGDLSVSGFIHGFTSAVAANARKKIYVAFDGIVGVQAGNFDVVNATGNDCVALKTNEPLDCFVTVVNCTGETVRKERVHLSRGINEISGPVSGFAFFAKDEDSAAE